MADTGLTLKVDFKDRDGFLPMLKKASLVNTSSLMRKIGMRMRKHQVGHFKKEEDSSGGKWQPLSQVTLEARRKGKKKGRRKGILKDNGLLRDTISWSSDPDRAEVGSNQPYAATHQFGRKGGGWQGSDIPAREFLYISETEGKELAQIIGDEMFKWMKKK